MRGSNRMVGKKDSFQISLEGIFLSILIDVFQNFSYGPSGNIHELEFVVLKFAERNSRGITVTIVFLAIDVDIVVWAFDYFEVTERLFHSAHVFVAEKHRRVFGGSSLDLVYRGLFHNLKIVTPFGKVKAR